MSEPANRYDRPGGGKVYRHPLTGEEFDSVTTILDLVDKAALKRWSAMVAADHALDNVPKLLTATSLPDCGNTFNRCYLKHGRDTKCDRCPCGDCERCWWRSISNRHAYESKRRADEGTECHAAINHWILSGGEKVSLRKEVEPYFSTFLSWVLDYGLEPRRGDELGSWEQTEVTLLNRTYMYAGTSDGAVWLVRGTTDLADQFLDQLPDRPSRALIRVDYKTREKEKEALYMDMPFQGVGYERCEVAMLPDGQEFPAPKTAARAVLQFRPNDYSFKLMKTDDGTFDAFLGILVAFRWIERYRKTAFDPAHIFPPTVAMFAESFSAMEQELEVVHLPPPPLGDLPWDEQDPQPISEQDPEVEFFEAVHEAEVETLACTHPVDARSVLRSGVSRCTVCGVEINTVPTVIPHVTDLPNEPGPGTVTLSRQPTPSGFDVPWDASQDAGAPPATPKKAAPRKRATGKSATTKHDPFDLAQSGVNPTLASMSSQLSGPLLARLDEPLPF